MKTVIVLAMHGAPPSDFPKRELAEFFSLHSRLVHPGGKEEPTLEQCYHELETRIRAWPRTSENDPFYSGSQDLAANLRKSVGLEVIVGFNEFCAPTLNEALERAVEGGAGRVVVVTPMMTSGGEHSEKDIPNALNRARVQHPEVEFCYAWPFDSEDVAEFLAARIRKQFQNCDGL